MKGKGKKKFFFPLRSIRVETGEGSFLFRERKREAEEGEGSPLSFGRGRERIKNFFFSCLVSREKERGGGKGGFFFFSPFFYSGERKKGTQRWKGKELFPLPVIEKERRFFFFPPLSVQWGYSGIGLPPSFLPGVRQLRGEKEGGKGRLFPPSAGWKQ